MYQRPAFWMQQCPSRQPALTHVHDARCADGHAIDQCCHCFETPSTAHFSAMPPVDIERRLNGEGPVLVRTEPRMAQGRYPGPEDDLGRGPLTEFQLQYLRLVRDSQKVTE